mmetsp:Transcript_38495/g.75601  ORF Transcript_38495/g.75601 Transcript_38495/m.75601 type:complete len:220 (+) Transcript_38495:105-764(+)
MCNFSRSASSRPTITGASSPRIWGSRRSLPNRSFAARLRCAALTRTFGSTVSSSQTSASSARDLTRKFPPKRASVQRSSGACITCPNRTRMRSAKNEGRLFTAASHEHKRVTNAFHCSNPSKFCPRKKTTKAAWSSPRRSRGSFGYSFWISRFSASLLSNIHAVRSDPFNPPDWGGNFGMSEKNSRPPVCIGASNCSICGFPMAMEDDDEEEEEAAGVG